MNLKCFKAYDIRGCITDEPRLSIRRPYVPTRGLRAPWRSLCGVFVPVLVANRLGYWLLPHARIHSQIAAPSSRVLMDDLG